MKKVKKQKAWADVGSNGGIFYFAMGEIARKYPFLMHVYEQQVSPDLLPVWIIPRKIRKKK